MYSHQQKITVTKRIRYLGSMHLFTLFTLDDITLGYFFSFLVWWLAIAGTYMYFSRLQL